MHTLTKTAPLLLGLGCGLVMPLTAQTFITSANWDSTNADLGQYASGQLSGTTRVSQSFQTPNGRNTGSVLAEASPGVLRAKADFSLGGLFPTEFLTTDPMGGPFRILGGQAQAAFTDTLTILPTNPTLMGSEGRVRFSIDVTGRMGTGHSFHSGTAVADWFIGGSGAFVSDPVRGEQIMPFFDLPSSGTLDYELVNGQSGAGNNLNRFGRVESYDYGANTDGSFITFDLPVYFGSPFDIGLELSVLADVKLDPFVGHDDTRLGSAYAIANFGNTARLGIMAVLDGTDQILGPSAFTMTSESGFNYAAVPEPESVAWVTGSALLLLAWRFRRS
jgi:hypothetical protein